MQSNSRALAHEMNWKEKEGVYQKKWALSWFLQFLRVSDDRSVAGGLFRDAGPATANARLPKLVFEHEFLGVLATHIINYWLIGPGGGRAQAARGTEACLMFFFFVALLNDEWKQFSWPIFNAWF